MVSCTFGLVIPFLLISSMAVWASGHQFEVGGKRGWAPSQGNEPETYNEWAEQHRFHVGDSIYFKYEDDSVMVVNQKGYESCNGSSPIGKFGAGGATFEFDRYGYFYFISGDKDNCEAGQRIIIRVMVQNAYHPSSLAPAPSPTAGHGGGSEDTRSHSGLGPYSSASMVSFTCYLPTAIALALLVLHLLVMH